MPYWRNTRVSTVLSLFKSSARSKHTILSKSTVRQQPTFPCSTKLTYMQNTQMFRRPGQRSRYSDSLRAGLSGFQTPVEGEFFRTHPDKLRDPPSLLYDRDWVSFLRIQQPCRGLNHSTPSMPCMCEHGYSYTPTAHLRLQWADCGLVGDSLHLHVCLTLRSLTLYIYGAPILDVSRSHTTTQHSR